MSGGIGTLLELFYTWQLAQVRHISSKPIILLGELWQGLLAWAQDRLLDGEYIDAQDLDLIYLVSSCTEAFEIIRKSHEASIRGDEAFCKNYHRYKLNRTA
jgi:predicted Rossmann-fold nucleotide-binding protein